MNLGIKVAHVRTHKTYDARSYANRTADEAMMIGRDRQMERLPGQQIGGLTHHATGRQVTGDTCRKIGGCQQFKHRRFIVRVHCNGGDVVCGFRLPYLILLPFQ